MSLTLELAKIKPQSLTVGELATVILDTDELCNVPNITPSGFFLRLGDGATLGGLQLLIGKSQIHDLSMVASEIDITPDIAEYGVDKTVHDALDTLATRLSVGGTLVQINDAAETVTDIWSGNYLRSQFNAISSEIGSSIMAPVQDITELKAIDTTALTDKVLILVEDNGQYRFDLQSTSTEDIDSVIQPTTGSGRWIKMSSNTVHSPVTIAVGSANYLSIATGTQELNVDSLAKLDTANTFTEIQTISGINAPNIRFGNWASCGYLRGGVVAYLGGNVETSQTVSSQLNIITSYSNTSSAIKLGGTNNAMELVGKYNGAAGDIVSDILFNVNRTGHGTFASTIQATTAKLTSLTDGYLPYHVSVANGLADSSIWTDGTKVGIGTANIGIYKLNVAGTGYFSDKVTAGADATANEDLVRFGQLNIAALADTEITTVADNDFMIYEAAAGKWKNEQVTVICKGGARS